MKNKNDCSIKLKSTNILWLLFFLIVIFISILAFSMNIMLAGQVPTGPSQIFFSAICIIIMLTILVFLLIGGINIYKNRYIELQNDYIKIVKRVGKLQKETECLKGKVKYKCDEFLITDICKMGYSNELYGHLLEFHQGKASYQIKNYEMVFVLMNGERITVDISWFSKKKMKKFFTIVYKKTQLIPEKKLRKDLGINVL